MLNIGKLTATSVNTQTMTIKLALIAPYQYVDGVPVLPAMTCITPSYERIFANNYTPLEMYDSSYITVDNGRKYTRFTGKYVLSTDAASELMYMWSNVHRGKPFYIADGILGVFDMFGDGDAMHEIIIDSISVDPLGYEYRDVKIEILKVGE